MKPATAPGMLSLVSFVAPARPYSSRAAKAPTRLSLSRTKPKAWKKRAVRSTFDAPMVTWLGLFSMISSLRRER